MTETKIPEIFTPEYDFIDNGAGDLMIVMEAVDKIQDRPVFYFDGVFQALFKRRADQLIPLPHVTSKVREMLSTVKKILVAEMDEDDEISEIYEAPVIIPEDGVLPYPKEIMENIDLSSLLPKED